MGYSGYVSDKPKKKMAIDILTAHPNYKMEMPKEDDTLLSYTLRYVGNVISPPQNVEESYDVECTTIKEAVGQCYLMISLNWRNHIKEKLKKEVGE